MSTAEATIIIVEVGLTCPKCGGNEMRVKRTKRAENEIKRKRECLDCGCRMVTTERSIIG